MSHDSPDSRQPAALEDIIETFALLDDWEERYRYLIDLGRTLAPLPDSEHCEANRVRGCVSQVWLKTEIRATAAGEKILFFHGDSDAHIVRGLVALALAIFSGKSARDILAADADAIFATLGLSGHLTPQRSNGLRSMVERIKEEARRSLI